MWWSMYLLIATAATGFCLGRATELEHFPWALFVDTLLGTHLSGVRVLHYYPY
jgi:hypothetical protein